MSARRLDIAAMTVTPSVGDWRAALLRDLAAGERLVTMYGRPDGEDVRITAVTEATDGELRATRTVAQVEQGIHTLAEEHPAAHIFEREIYEQWGLRMRGHPWLKPVRFETGNVDDYPFLSMHGKEIHEVQVGPIHAGVIEPGAFRFSCHGERVFHLEIALGYQHRGIERKLLGIDPHKAGPLVSVIAGDSTIAHSLAWVTAVEALTGAVAPEDRADGRDVMLELERVAMHLAGLAGLAQDVGFLQGATTYGRLRTVAINTSMRLCGSRFGRTAVRASGTGVCWDGALRETVLSDLAKLDADARLIDERFLGSASVRHRLRETGTVETSTARALGLVGPSARSSGVPIDQRVFTEPGFRPVVRDSGDCMARAELRAEELHASLHRVCELLRRRERADKARGEPLPLTAERLVVASVEGWRGEVVYALETDAAGRLVHCKVQDPSLRNWMGLAISMRDQEISDFPICNKSFDLSYCGNDL